MRQMTRVTMSMRELDRLKCIQAVVDGDLQPGRAAERLELTVRQIAAPGDVEHVLGILRAQYAVLG
jgi:hypothetical protein